MSNARGWLRRFAALFQRQRWEEDFEEELESHIQLDIEDGTRSGLSAKEARRRALLRLGGIEAVREAHRDRRAIPVLESAVRDVAYSLRMMRLHPGFTATICVTLALGIGVCTAIFTAAQAVLLAPLRIPGAGRAVILLSTNQRDRTAFSVAEGVFLDWRTRASSFELFSGCWPTGMILSGDGQARDIDVTKVTAQFFDVAGLRAIHGVLFDAFAEQPGHDDVAVLDQGFWLRFFGGRKDLVGRQIRLDDRLYTVIGIAPRLELGHLGKTDAWIPFLARSEARSGGALNVIARLRPGVSREAAQAEMQVIHQQVGRDHPEDSPFGVEVRSLQNWLANDARPSILALAGAVALLMSMCCLNIANLLLSRATLRDREFAIRFSLGGGRARLVRQLLTENLLLTAMGGLGGYLIAVTLVRSIANFQYFYVPRLEEIQPDGRMMLIALVITIGTGLSVGLAPAWRGSRKSVREVLGVPPASGTTAPSGMRLRRTLVFVQLALSVVLLSGAGLLLNAFVKLVTLDAGFSKANVLAARIRLPKEYDATRSLLFERRLLGEVGSLPCVLEVSAADYPPLMAVHFPFALVPEGSRRKPIEALARHIEPRYFSVLGVPLVAGREFQPADETRSPVPVVLNVRQLGLKQDPGPQVFFPLRFGWAQYLIARVANDAGGLPAAIRAAVFRLDAGVPAPEITNVRTWFERELAKPRFYLLLIGAFSIAGLLIAAGGTYGLVSFNAAHRTQEFGIRMAMGAGAGDILKAVLSRELILIAAGVAAGAAGALGSTRVLVGLLYGIRPHDAATLLAACLALAATALVACYLAARRATRLEPSAALRRE